MADMQNLMAMFPGQGSQYVGMGNELLKEFPYCKEIFERAEDTLHLSIRKICLEGPDEELKLTKNTQPCILTTSMATWTVLKHEIGLTAQVFAGHSLGEYSALVAAGVMDFAAACQLVHERGKFMQDAVPAGVGAMAAVLNLDEEKLAALCQEVSRGEQDLVQIANFNSPGQLVVAGKSTAVDRLEAKLKELGTRSVRLPVSAPFHCKLMAPARQRMTPLLEATKIAKTGASVIPNRTAEVTTDYKVDYLITQIDHAVMWTQTMNEACKKGMTTYVEVGPGKVLMGLAKRCLPKGEFRLINTDPVKEAIKLFAL